MKKILLFAAVTAVALSSCSKNEVTMSSTDNQAIGFDVYAGVSTKGVITDNGDAGSTTTTSIKDGFGVFGYMHEAENAAAVSAASVFGDSSTPNFMYNSEVTMGTTYWTYSPVKYWPNDTNDRITFLAYAPYRSSVTTSTEAATDGTNLTIADTNTAGTPTLTYTIANAPEDQVDLVADLRYNMAKSGAQGTATESANTDDATVAFSFEHLLTRLNFQFALGDDIVATTGNDDKTLNDNTTTTRVFITDLQLVGTENASLYDMDGAIQTSAALFKTATYKFDAAGTDGVDATDLGNWVVSGTDDVPVSQEANYDLLDGTDANFLAVNASATEVVTASVSPAYSALTYAQYSAIEVSSATQANIFTENQYLFLIPPQDDALAESGDVMVYIQYDVITPDATLALGYSKVTNHTIVDLSGLKKATAYNYKFTIGLSSVKVSADVVGWGEVSDYSSDIETDVTTTVDGQ